MFVFQCVIGNTIGKYPGLLGLFVWIENPVKCNACTVNQKIGVTWFIGNALISMEALFRIS